MTGVRKKTLYIETFGCQMNVNDTDRMFAMLADKGYERTDHVEGADLILLNTCSVRGTAEQRMYGHLGALKRLKQKKPSLIIGVSGCVAQQEGERILKKVRHVDLVVGTHNLHLLPDMVAAAEGGGKRAETAFLEDDTRISLYPTVNTAGGVTAFVTAMQGCDNFCTYCIVPYVRGREVSRPAADIVEEVRRLADSGTREVTLLGQNVNSYGLKDNNGPDFATLIRMVAKVDGIERIRFMTSHPKDISPALIACYADVEKLCSHIHLPAQSGSDRVLDLMGRGYTSEHYLSSIRALRRARPGILFTGDMIAGFPGETDDDFHMTLSLMEEVRYADLFSFIYSVRPGTKAAEFPEQLSYGEKQERLHRLQSLQLAITKELHESMVGTCQRILVEGESKRRGQLTGRTDGNRIINFEAASDKIGAILDLTVTKALQTSLFGRVI
jgi:tRNA-2-methylthio-N6-dimethylallyladenosine synthase